MILKKFLLLFVSLIYLANSYAESEWTFIGKTADNNSVYTTNAESMTDGSLRIFLKGQVEKEREPQGLFAFLKKPEKYIETIGPVPILVHCKKRAVRN